MHAQSLQAKLFAAIEAGDVAQIEAIVASGADIDSALNNLDGSTPLIRAITASQLNIVQILISGGADVDRPQSSPRGWTPLMFAFQQPEIMKELLNTGADVDARTPVREIVSPRTGKRVSFGRESALHIVAAANQLECARLLVEAGAEIDCRTIDDLGPLDIALRQGSANAVAEFLISAGVELTPSRLQLIHSTAFEGDEDVYKFIWVERFQLEPKKSQPEQQTNLRTAGETNIAGTTFSCPSCGSLLYTRKSSLCGKCGAALPPDLISRMNRVHQQRHEERAKARELADAFGYGAAAKSCAPRSYLTQNEDDALPSATELLRRTSCAAEFRARKRPFFWLYLVGYGSTFLVGILLFAILRTITGVGVLAMAGVTLVMTYLTWLRASPICPNCQQHIVTCVAAHCHVCGKPLSGDHCNSCAVGGGIASWLSPCSHTGNFRWITYCPGCGVLLESKNRRRRGIYPG